MSHDHYLGQRLIQEGLIYHEYMGCVCVEGGGEGWSGVGVAITLTDVVTESCQQRSLFCLFHSQTLSEREIQNVCDLPKCCDLVRIRVNKPTQCLMTLQHQ